MKSPSKPEPSASQHDAPPQTLDPSNPIPLSTAVALQQQTSSDQLLKDSTYLPSVINSPVIPASLAMIPSDHLRGLIALEMSFPASKVIISPPNDNDLLGLTQGPLNLTLPISDDSMLYEPPTQTGSSRKLSFADKTQAPFAQPRKELTEAFKAFSLRLQTILC